MALVVNLCKFPLTSHPCVVLFLTAGSACLPYLSFCSNQKISKGTWESFGRSSPKKTRISPCFPDGFLFVCVLAFLFVSLFAFPREGSFLTTEKNKSGGSFVHSEQNTTAKGNVIPVTATGIFLFCTFLCFSLKAISSRRLPAGETLELHLLVSLRRSCWARLGSQDCWRMATAGFWQPLALWAGWQPLEPGRALQGK